MARKRGQNEGSFTRRADGLWMGRVSVPGAGRETFYGRTREEAHRKVMARLRAAHTGAPRPERITLAQLIARWLADADLAENTRRRYEREAARWVDRLGSVPVASLTAAQVQEFLNRLSVGGVAPSSVRHYRAVIRAALNQAVVWGVAPANVAAGPRVRLPRLVQRRAPVIGAAEGRAILTAFAGHWLEPLVTVTLGTGLRQGEVLGLTWDAVDCAAGTIAVSQQLQRYRGDGIRAVGLKSEKARRVLVVAPGVLAALARRRVAQEEARRDAGESWVESGLVFTTGRGRPLAASNVARAYRRQLERAGLPPLHFHDLRHGAASMMLEQGASLKEISDALGHSQIGITADLYAHVPGVMQAATAGRLQGALFGE